MMQKHQLHLWHYWRSSCSWRLRWALAAKGLEYQSTHVNLLEKGQESPSYLAINPSGLVPTLSINQKYWSESLAILEWLEETYPSPPLLPEDPAERLFVRQICLTIVSGIQPLQNLRALQQHSDDPIKRKEHAQYWIERGFSSIESLLQNAKSSLRCLRQTTTLADLCLVPQVYNALRHEVSLSEYPRIKAIYESCLLDPHCFSSSPEQQNPT